ncbi:MAG: rRNA maturation RNase YbeY [Spirochaetia bacterium]|nr:rRNA maturation RNase YbeY [Spirochaetia bacterium]
MITINNLNKDKIPEKKLKEIGEFVLNRFNKSDYIVSVAFVSKNKMGELNNIYRGINKVTDILSFSLTETSKDDWYEDVTFIDNSENKEDKGYEEDNFLGDLVISCYQIKKQAKELKNSFEYELIFIFVHGLLHLLGYKDDEYLERERMIKLGEELIKEYNEFKNETKKEKK